MLNLQRMFSIDLKFEDDMPGLRLSVGDGYGWKFTTVSPLKVMLAVPLMSRIFMSQNHRCVFFS